MMKMKLMTIFIAKIHNKWMNTYKMQRKIKKNTKKSSDNICKETRKQLETLELAIN